MRVQLLDEAELDLVDGFCFYEAQQTGLGDYFLNSLFSDIDSLQLFAGIHRRHLGFYRLLSKRFPFAIYYRIVGEVVNVHAVMDCRQNPERIRERLE
jgi:hypothetical protein